MAANDKASNEALEKNARGSSPKGVIIDLFGREKSWDSAQWTASDDRVRGGKSQSYLRVSDDKSIATFYGNLDIEALGGAGFASQRTTASAGGPWDLSEATGIFIGLESLDDRIYTIVVKDEILPKRPDGREQSTTSYEFSFSVSTEASEDSNLQSRWGNSLAECSTKEPYAMTSNADFVTIYIPWEFLRPYYRGKRKPDAPELDTSNIQRISIMCRSMFGLQHGDFSMDIKYILAVSTNDSEATESDALYSRLKSSCCEDAFPFYKCSLVRRNSKLKSNDDEWDLIEDLEELKLESSKEPTEQN
ncbi:hypothetical protein H072_306 [Dactylellina haptotyla CBS 200.50]|uniref:NADH:ubiquinone oxidoreductase intermediate-associated protein 30 domain-containing protein n=1 Tax=Dactylellina haptotyla (strain CBS 200.50) TaxID=1284197 RepID=S8ASM8_DACHA|nr:hypothetical protein H072_306 [Dactylellina haptotyla CBS 200.50]